MIKLQRIIKFWLEHPFNALHVRLLLGYLSVMSAVLGLTVIFIYQYFAHNLYFKLDRQIANLADAASHSLPKIKAHPDLVQKTAQKSAQKSAQNLAQSDRIFDNDGDLDIPWQDMRQQQQTVEWFDIDGKLLAKSGKELRDLPFVPVSQNSLITQVQHIKEDDDLHDLRSLTMPIYVGDSFANSSINSPTKNLIGYVRVSESSEELEEELEKLLWGLGWGSLLAIALSGIGGWWLAWQALQPIKRNYEQMRQFTADASHELRSPLTAIKTSIDVIQNHPERIHQADVKKLAAIAHATEQMTHLVEDLLFLARIDNENLDGSSDRTIKLLLIPIDELLEDLLELLEPQIIAKKINLQANLSNVKKNDVSIRGDAHQLRRLFINLLENAIAYTAIGGTIKVDLQLHDRADRWLIISISDTGLGIAPEDLPYIFERFWRADRARSWRAGGSGLGLAIAEAIVKTHGGNITVSSQVSIGSCFSEKFHIR